MQGYRFTTDRHLPERDMQDLADSLAMQIHELLGARVYMLARNDVIELIEPYVDDLAVADQRDMAWMIWHLFQDARDMELRGQ